MVRVIVKDNIHKINLKKYLKKVWLPATPLLFVLFISGPYFGLSIFPLALVLLSFWSIVVIYHYFQYGKLLQEFWIKVVFFPAFFCWVVTNSLYHEVLIRGGSFEVHLLIVFCALINFILAITISAKYEPPVQYYSDIFSKVMGKDRIDDLKECLTKLQEKEKGNK